MRKHDIYYEVFTLFYTKFILREELVSSEILDNLTKPVKNRIYAEINTECLR